VTDGDVVHLIRFNDRACETTIRHVRVLPDHTYELRGDPEKDQPIALADFKPQTDIEVRGVFIGQYRPKAS
jgi:hypothetical protein